MIFRLVSVLCLLRLSSGEDDKKWVWKDKGKERGGNARYQVVEDGPGSVDFDRPVGLQQEFGFPDRPIPGPGGFDRPGNYPSGGFRPHPPDQGILTGPVPSWVREPPFKHYDKCKCAEKFNCNSPGISYGQCDVGKQYCCYNSNKDGVLGGPLPSRPIYSPQSGILSGPGGPIDYPQRPHHHNGGVLVGPGGPTGIIGRPPNRPFDRPIQNPNLGVLVGPYNEPFRPPEVPYGGPYGRRSDPKKTKDIK